MLSVDDVTVSSLFGQVAFVFDNCGQDQKFLRVVRVIDCYGAIEEIFDVLISESPSQTDVLFEARMCECQNSLLIVESWVFVVQGIGPAKG